MADTPDATRRPQRVELDPGAHWLCTCGFSSHTPFCDGSHKGTGKQPFKLDLAETKTIWLCRCNHSQDLPFCDGSHKHLPVDPPSGS